jgi:hypothetical protein
VHWGGRGEGVKADKAVFHLENVVSTAITSSGITDSVLAIN